MSHIKRYAPSLPPTGSPLQDVVRATWEEFQELRLTLAQLASMQLYQEHTFVVTGTVAVPSGATNYLPPFFAAVREGTSLKLVGCRYKIHSGTSATVKVQINGSDATGFTGLVVTTTAASTTPTAITLAHEDLVALVVTAVSGAPTHLSFTLFFELGWD